MNFPRWFGAAFRPCLLAYVVTRYAFDPLGSPVSSYTVDFNWQELRFYDAYGQMRTGYPLSDNYGDSSQLGYRAADYAEVGLPVDDPVGFGGQWGYYSDHPAFEVNYSNASASRLPSEYSSPGLLLLGHRYYDPSVARFYTRDPIGYEGGINLYAYCGNNPIMGIDPSGLAVAIFIHGTNSSNDKWTPALLHIMKIAVGATSHDVHGWPGGVNKAGVIEAGAEFASYLDGVKRKHPHERIFIIGHSNGGNVGLAGALASKVRGNVVLVRLGSPNWKDKTDEAKGLGLALGLDVIDAYDPRDPVVFGARTEAAKRLFGADWDAEAATSSSNWTRVQVKAPGALPRIHSRMTESSVMRQIVPLLRNLHLVGDERLIGHP